MRRTAEYVCALAMFAALSWAGTRTSLPMPGPVVGLAAYLLLLATGAFDWTLGPARWLAGLLGAMIVPPLVGIAAFSDVVVTGGWRLALVLVAGTLVTGVATAMLFRVAGGRA